MDAPGANNPDAPLGIVYWAQHYPNKIPRYEVFKSIGQMPITNAWMFRGMKSFELILKKDEDLNEDGFKPFLLNLERLRKDFGSL